MLHITNLVVEVTRRCNMNCAHCLRGDAQCVDIDHKYIDSLFNQVESIGHVTFTGGEPSLNIKALEYFLECAIKHNCEIDSYYIATNGLNIREEFINFLTAMFRYCDDQEHSHVHISNDMFHSSEDSYDIGMFAGLNFVSLKFNNDYYDYNRYDSIRPVGRGADMSTGYYEPSTLEPINAVTVEEVEEANLYLNAKGNILLGCDHSYEDQDNKCTICNVDGLTEYYNSLETED